VRGEGQFLRFVQRFAQILGQNKLRFFAIHAVFSPLKVK
jgi:hypothetical protein